MKDWVLAFAGIGAVAIGIVLFVGFIMWVMNSLSLGPSLAKIEQVRADSAHVDPQQAEDVIGQVTVWNQTIVSNQAWNRMPLIGLAVPDEWDHVALIPVPR